MKNKTYAVEQGIGEIRRLQGLTMLYYPTKDPDLALTRTFSSP